MAKQLFNAIQIDFDEIEETIIFTEPDYGMGEMKLSIPFTQLEAVYLSVKKVMTEKEQKNG